jgi:hypothetical protein
LQKDTQLVNKNADGNAQALDFIIDTDACGERLRSLGAHARPQAINI